MFSVCGMKMIAAEWMRLELITCVVVSESARAASVLPDLAIISVFGLVFTTYFDPITKLINLEVAV